MSKRRAPTKSYTESLEMRLQMMQRLLEKHATHAELEKELGFALQPTDLGASSLSRSSSDDSLSSPAASCSEKWGAPGLIHVVDQIYNPENTENTIDGSMLYSDINETAQLVARLTDEPSTRYYGESSAWKFLRILEQMGKDHDANRVTKLRTSVPWGNESWFKSLFQYDNSRPPSADYPEDDLLHLLVDLYFRHVNQAFPIIHEPTFRARISDHLHLQDRRFGHLLLAILTIASLYTADERVFEEVDGLKVPGLRFFNQIKDWNKSLAPAVLTDLQAGFLLTLYRWALGQMHEAWISLGVGIRFAQDIGAHRQCKINTLSDRIDAEQWKRCFWCFVIFDRFVSSSLGQPLTVHEEDVDIAAPAPYPGDADPKDKTCVEFLKLTLRLGSYLTIALRSIYSAKPPTRTAFPKPKFVEQLDAGLDRWLQSVPEDCRWKPDTEDLLALEHSGQLMCDYYYTTIMIHRPLISRGVDHYPGLEMCTSAASACVAVLDVMASRLVLLSPHLCYIAWACGIVLLTKLWVLEQSNPLGDVDSVRSDLRRCIQMLRAVAKRWNKTQRMIDILFDLAQNGGIPLTYPKTSSRRQSPRSHGDYGSSNKSNSHHTMPRSQTVTVSPPAPPPPPPSTLFPQPAPRHHSPPLTSLVDPASVVQPDGVLENGFSDCLNGPPVHIHHPVKPMTPIHPQLMPNLGASCCGENLLGTWFQTPHIGDGRIQIPELQGWDTWCSFLAGVDAYATSPAGNTACGFVDMDGIFSFTDIPSQPDYGSSGSSVTSSRPGTSSDIFSQQSPVQYYDMSATNDNHVIMNTR